ncbi:chromophore lyase [Chryseobacterium sp. Leaf180]|uniref:T9SS type B sorting domain-containing protein n=1 Tax=Chryseobacterium sp. Leaf180 TaxID=1736289 RepID=UPI0006F8F1D0|nr:gliding motility-associated C-terminal domain-containing protein [Chryseobacterium sp. Leaf180]KQR95454.1 chromophore lyase [Chryseobacterium sp. Leaf180]
MKKTLLFFLIIFSQLFFSQSDCPTAITVCGNSGISYTPSGAGNILEDLQGCLVSDEHYSVWYTFTVATAGTLTFTINPNVFADDYDFAVYGPNKQCSNLGLPVRCNFSGADGPTGLSTLATDPNGAFPNGGQPGQFSSALNVLPGETYYLVVDNYSLSANGFTLTWSGSAQLASPFNDPTLITNPFITPGLPNANPNGLNEVIVCTNPATFNFNTLSTGIINGNTNFTVQYFLNTNDQITGTSPITTPIIVNTTDTYYYNIVYTDPTNPNNPINRCALNGSFKFKDGTITINDATLTKCNNNNEGTAVFNLTDAAINSNATYTLQYFPSMFDLNNNTNQITNIYQYPSAGGSVYVLATSPFGCKDIAEIKLQFYPVVVVNEATIRSCAIETNPSTGKFDLTVPSVTLQSPVTKKYYPSAADAVNQTNEILTPTNYIAPTGFVYVRVINGNGCFTVAKINLIVIPQVFSTVLKDKTICFEGKTTLDAGPGFTSYLWSTGATTQTINNVGIGNYTVVLKTGECTVTQKVTVFPSEQPVISDVDINNTTVTVNVAGGTPQYEYSLDNVKWQTSNIFTDLGRGDHTIYVRDSYNCTPIQIVIVVPNLINVITPNGDGVNDLIDYSSLAGKKNLTMNIYDRYGYKVHTADRSNGYKWNGTTNGNKKVQTGTYWYSLTWSENNKNSTSVKYSGWIMVKNRE